MLPDAYANPVAEPPEAAGVALGRAVLPPAWPVVLGAVCMAMGASLLLQRVPNLVFLGFRPRGGQLYDLLLQEAWYATNPLLIFAGALLWNRKLAGYLLLPVVAVVQLVVMGVALVPDVQQRVGGGPINILSWLSLADWAWLVLDGDYIRAIACSVGLLIWLARPRIIRQVIDWRGTVGIPLSAQAGMRYARRVWPAAVGAVSITLAAWGLVGLPGRAYSIRARYLSDSLWLRVHWTWLQAVGNLNIRDTIVDLMPGVLSVGVLVAGVALVRRWWTAGPLHLALAAMLLAFAACLLTGWPWYDDPGEFAGWQLGRSYYVLEVLCNPIFWLYPLLLLAWFLRPVALRQVRTWRRVAVRRAWRASRWGRRLAMAARAACLLVAILLPLATWAWRSWPKTQPGIEVFGQGVCLPVCPKAEQPILPPRNDDTVVCVDARGRLYLDGRRQPSVEEFRRVLAPRRAADPEGRVWLAADRRARFASVRPVLGLCGSFASTLFKEDRYVLLLVEHAVGASNWTGALWGRIQGVTLWDERDEDQQPIPLSGMRVHVSAGGTVCLKDGDRPPRTGVMSGLKNWAPLVSGRLVVISADDDVAFEQVILAATCLAGGSPRLQIAPPGTPATRPAANGRTSDK